MLSLTLDKISKQGATLIIGIVIVAYAVFILFHTPILNILIKLASRIIKKEIDTVSISFKSILFTQIFYVISNLFFCFGGYLLCIAIGITDDFRLLIIMIGSLLVGDVVGFVVLVTPGGLGVREITMTFIISGVAAASKEIAIIIPVATRLLTMSVDITLGITAFFLGHKSVFKSDVLLKSKREI
jgi:glycosyltransferase 2 family protein